MTSFNLQKFFLDIFAPRKNEKVLFLLDMPTKDNPDNEEWRDRRRMAIRWYSTLKEMATKLNINILPMAFYSATGANNAPLPSKGTVNNIEKPMRDIIKRATLCIAMTEFSATAPLVTYGREFPRLRSASMPGVAPRMEKTALSADYSKVYERAHILAQKLTLAESARVLWSTDQEFLFDLRFRKGEADDGRLPPNLPPENPRLINLPSGEAYIAPYEGEHEGKVSLTAGEIPVLKKGELFTFIVKENRIIDIQGDGPEANHFKQYFKKHCPICGNIAELGLGCNEKAVLWGNILEDEKVMGLHLAYGRSEHIGGRVGPEAFPEGMVIHEDIIYAKGTDPDSPYVAELTLMTPDGKEELILQNGEYTLKEHCFKIPEAHGWRKDINGFLRRLKRKGY
ncbi:MAG: hypothetical protein ACFFDT_40540 [Candidatus Hodarchaeota archaeon]